MKPPPRRAALLDRDGVINVDHGYVHRPQDFEFLPGVPRALRRLQDAGLALVVVTNQSGLARGLFDAAQYAALARHLRSLLAAHGVHLDGLYHCPHLPAASPGARVAEYRLDCDCRKPRPGLILRAARELQLDLAGSLLLGDSARDIEAGRAAGVGRCVLVHADEQAARACGADAAYPDLWAAACALVSEPPDARAARETCA